MYIYIHNFDDIFALFGTQSSPNVNSLIEKSDNDKNMTQVILKSAKFFAEEKQTFPDGTTIKMNEFFSESEAQEN